MSKNAIETLSVNAVKNSIVMSEFLDQFINDNDKEPSWDGFVYIYGDKSKKKSKLKGRMPVQVKGTECDDHSKDVISFSMSTVDLRNYLYDGGCILFVVYIGNGGLTNKIYYIELTPLKLRTILEEAKGQASKSIKLTEFPYDNNKKATIFLNCLQNCQKQASFKEGELLSLKALQEQGVLENLVIPFSGVGIDDPQMALITNEVYLYAKIKGSSIPQPVEILPQGVHTHQVINATITIDDRVFYTEYKVIKSADEVTFCFGNSLEMKFATKDGVCQAQYRNSDKIRVLAKDLDFMLTYFDKGYFKLNGVEFPFDYDGVDTTNFDIEKEREHLNFAKDIVKVLDMLGCSEDIDINDMNDADWRNLNRLITAFIDKEPVQGLKKDLPLVSCMKVGKLKFVFYLKKCSEIGSGTYEVYDFFKTELELAFENSDGQMLPISQFCILHATDLLTLNNINYDVLLPSFQKAEHHHETFTRANWFLLELLEAHDKADGVRKEQLLKVCEEFANWIFEATDEELEYPIRLLNKLQVVKRRRELNIDEVGLLYELVESKGISEAYIVGAYLLLDQQRAAEIHFKKLNSEEQEEFRKYPIYRYWKTDKSSD